MRRAVARRTCGRRYDDVWAGGWEELFPNDAPGRFEGRELPDHGEWWAVAVGCRLADTAAGSRRLTAQSRCHARILHKEFSSRTDESQRCRVHYRDSKRRGEPFHFLFKQHLPIRHD